LRITRATLLVLDDAPVGGEEVKTVFEAQTGMSWAAVDEEYRWKPCIFAKFPVKEHITIDRDWRFTIHTGALRWQNADVSMVGNGRVDGEDDKNGENC